MFLVGRRGGGVCSASEGGPCERRCEGTWILLFQGGQPRRLVFVFWKETPPAPSGRAVCLCALRGAAAASEALCSAPPFLTQESLEKDAMETPAFTASPQLPPFPWKLFPSHDGLPLSEKEGSSDGLQAELDALGWISAEESEWLAHVQTGWMFNAREKVFFHQETNRLLSLAEASSAAVAGSAALEPERNREALAGELEDGDSNASASEAEGAARSDSEEVELDLERDLQAGTAQTKASKKASLSPKRPSAVAFFFFASRKGPSSASRDSFLLFSGRVRAEDFLRRLLRYSRRTSTCCCGGRQRVSLLFHCRLRWTRWRRVRKGNFFTTLFPAAARAPLRKGRCRALKGGSFSFSFFL